MRAEKHLFTVMAIVSHYVLLAWACIAQAFLSRMGVCVPAGVRGAKDGCNEGQIRSLSASAC